MSDKNAFQSLPEDVAIQVTNVTKSYYLRHEKPTLVEQLLRRGHSERYTALNKVNLTIKKGEKVGIVGPNGAGKTTLLKLIAGITVPDSGIIQTQGKIVSLIDISAGFQPDLTGEENIFLNGLLLGMRREEVEAKFEHIVRFADIGRFIDAPFYTYSQGMKLRVGFAVAMYSDPSILLLDEGVSVGDELFRNKIFSTLTGFKNISLLLASHSEYILDELTTKIVTL